MSLTMNLNTVEKKAILSVIDSGKTEDDGKYKKMWGELRDWLVCMSDLHLTGADELHEPARYIGLMQQVEISVNRANQFKALVDDVKKTFDN